MQINSLLANLQIIDTTSVPLKSKEVLYSFIAGGIGAEFSGHLRIASVGAETREGYGNER